MTSAAFSALALSFPHTECNPHFDRNAFKVTGKRIFATLLQKDQTVNVVLSPEEQEAFCKMNAKGIYPVPNKWGEKGWTTFELARVPDDLVQAAVTIAYEAVFQSSASKIQK
ncbi:MAG TPA: MmcQ/YjbR family DNA-binding protein [Flavipsychrobacter sp.]|nr:MmcQ/YjbR family DNA-binding protein [Flavipsychrobacter sp.]